MSERRQIYVATYFYCLVPPEHLPKELTDECCKVLISCDSWMKHEPSSSVDHLCFRCSPPCYFSLAIPLLELSNLRQITFTCVYNVGALSRLPTLGSKKREKESKEEEGERGRWREGGGRERRKGDEGE